MMARKLRIGIVGAGNICISSHLPVFAKLADQVEVVAIADAVLDRAKSAAEEFNIPHYFATVEE